MEPIHSLDGLEAAKKAATAVDFDKGLEFEDGIGESGNIPEEKHCFVRFVEEFFVIIMLPFIWIYDIFVLIIGRRLFEWSSKVYKSARNQGSLFLNGLPPYECSARITTVNIIVLCSTWYMFIDQLRLAFFPPQADYTLSIINFVIWTILVLELIFEVFIRPDGYYRLIRSDKAFTPATVRYISWFHLFVESISLLFFAPEFWCLFNPDLSCSGRPKFSFLRTTLMLLFGSDRSEALGGIAFYACVRLRVFGLVRHWRNMWIRKTFIQRPSVRMRFISDRKSISTERSTRRSSIDNRDTESVLSGGGFPFLHFLHWLHQQLLCLQKTKPLIGFHDHE